MIKVLHVLPERVSLSSHHGANDSVEALSMALKKKNMDSDTCNALVKRYVAVADTLSGKYAHREVSYDDLYQAALKGLKTAIDHIDPENDFEFLGFAISTIIAEMKRHIYDTGWYARSPQRIKDLSEKIIGAKTLLMQELNHIPKISDLASQLNCSEEEIIEAMETDWEKSLTPGKRYKRKFMKLIE